MLGHDFFIADYIKFFFMHACGECFLIFIELSGMIGTF